MSLNVFQNTSDDEIEDIHRYILTSITDTIDVLAIESIYGAMNANYQRTDEFYTVKFLSTAHTLQHYETIDNELLKSGALVSDVEHMSPTTKDSMWYVKSGIESVKVNMEKEDVVKKEPFKFSVNDYENIFHETSRRESIDFEIGSNDGIKTVEI
eukprot:8383740-Ditylum_brightwellii.AAC.1